MSNYCHTLLFTMSDGHLFTKLLTLCLCVPARVPRRKRKKVAVEPAAAAVAEAVVDQRTLNAKWFEDGH